MDLPDERAVCRCVSARLTFLLLSLQITAEQIVREAKERQEEEYRAPKQKAGLLILTRSHGAEDWTPVAGLPPLAWPGRTHARTRTDTHSPSSLAPHALPHPLLLADH